MRFLFVTFLAALGVFLGGCETVLRPSAKTRRESGVMAPKVDDRAVFFLIGSNSPLTITSFSGEERTFNFKFANVGPYFGGLATAFTHDGYLLTAGHEASAYLLVIGVMDGRVRVAPARVVYKQSFGTYGTDLAIIHVDQRIDHPLPLGQFVEGQHDVYGLAWDLDTQLKVLMIGGKIRSAARSALSDQIVLLDTDLPSWHGDSGGGALSRDGKLIGIITGFKTKWSEFHNAKNVCAPSKGFIESIVAKDRAEQANQTATKLQLTSDGPRVQ